MRARLDKWLWCARFFRTRVLAQEACGRGAVRVNGNRTVKPHFMVGPGDVLTFSQGSAIRVVRVTALAERRGSARDAAQLYVDLGAGDSPPPAPDPSEGGRAAGPRD